MGRTQYGFDTRVKMQHLKQPGTCKLLFPVTVLILSNKFIPNVSPVSQPRKAEMDDEYVHPKPWHPCKVQVWLISDLVL